MQRVHLDTRQTLLVAAVLLLCPAVGFAQDSRGSITGKVLDPQSALVAGANITVTNLGTNVSNTVTSSHSGYWEVNFLIPGEYSVTAESAGFKRVTRTGISLSTGDRLAVDLQLQIGDTTQSVTVTTDAPLLNTTNANTARVLNSTDMAQLPYTNMNPFALQAMAAGMIFTGSLQPDNNRALDHASTANYASGGLGTGTNEFLLDGNPVTGTNGGRAGYVPNAEAVDEVRIETSAFDASSGHAIGAFISATTKSGANDIHGAAFWQYQNFRWNATPHFTRLNYEAGIAAGTIKPGTEKQQSGKVTTPGFGVGGPVYIPKVFNGKNRLFFYVSYSHLTSLGPPVATPIYTVPTAAMRQGDFSALLTVPTNASTYIIYDPRTAATVAGHVTRTPFPSNIIPASMQTNPATKFWNQVFPSPNNPVGVNPDQTNNFYDSGQGNNDWFPDFVNRFDFVINEKQRLSSKWYFNHRFSDQYDWAHDTPLKGVMSNGLWRPARGGNIDWLNTLNPNNVLDVTLSISQYSEGSKKPDVLKYSAADLGLPAYIDQKAGGADTMPWMNISNMAYAASTSFVGQPGVNQRGTTEQLAIKMTSIFRNHTFKYGWDERRYYYASVNPLGNTTGLYTFTNTYVRQADNTASTASTNTGLAYASFLMGLPSSISLDTNDTGYWSTPYRALYFQDDFRVTSKLRIGFGVRYEHENGTNERFNRGLVGAYDYSFVPGYARAVESQYASLLANPTSSNAAAVALLQQGMPASAFKVMGGVQYAGKKYDTLTDGRNWFLPNLSVVYAINDKTVIRAGTGMFASTLNSFGSGGRLALTGYSQSTSTIISSDNGLTFCCGVGAASNLGAKNLMMDPFPVLASGSRWQLPIGNSLGSDVNDGSGATDTPRNYGLTWQQRYSLAFQRTLFQNNVLEVSYNGGFASQPFSQNLSYLPRQYWNFFNTRSATVDTVMQQTVANPFLAALPAISSSNPALYNYLSSRGLFTGSTLQVQQLLRAWPNANFGLTKADALRGHIVDNELRVVYHRRMAKGLQTDVQFAHMWGRQQWLPNQFDDTPAWQLNSNIRPNRLVWDVVYELPFGKGRPYLQRGPLAQAVGGWQLSWIYSYQTGSLISWANLYYYGSVDQVADVLQQEKAHSADIHQWFDRTAVWQGTTAPPSTFVGFEGRSAAQPNTYQARVFPQYFDSLRNDPLRNWDLKIQREIPLYERMKLQVSLDMLNVTNHTQFTGPNLTVTSTAFGQLTGQANSGRILQFNGRIQF